MPTKSAFDPGERSKLRNSESLKTQRFEQEWFLEDGRRFNTKDLLSALSKQEVDPNTLVWCSKDKNKRPLSDVFPMDKEHAHVDMVVEELLGSACVSWSLSDSDEGQAVVIRRPDDQTVAAFEEHAVKSGIFTLKDLEKSGAWAREQVQELYKAEARNLSELQHSPYTIGMLAQSSDNLELIMEYCGDGNLEDRLKQPYDLIEAMRWVQELATALVTLHARLPKRRVLEGLAPLDIQIKDGTLKLDTFGMSHEAQEIEGNQGRNHYTAFDAPEIRSRGYGKNPADIWSLGMLIYVLAKGQLPEPEADSQAPLRVTLEPPYRIPLSEDTVKLAHRCLSIDPNDRPSAKLCLRRLNRLRFRTAYSQDLGQTVSAFRRPGAWLGLLAIVVIVGLFLALVEVFIVEPNIEQRHFQSFLTQLKDGPTEARRGAVAKVSDYSHRASVSRQQRIDNALYAALIDPHPDILKELGLFFGQRPKKYLPVLDRGLRDIGRRRNSAWILKGFGQHALPVVLPHLSSRDKNLQSQAHDLFFEISVKHYQKCPTPLQKSIVTELLKGLSAPEEALQARHSECLLTLMRRHKFIIQDLLQRMTQGPLKDQAERAFLALGLDALPYIRAQLKNPKPAERLRAYDWLDQMAREPESQRLPVQQLLAAGFLDPDVLVQNKILPILGALIKDTPKVTTQVMVEAARSIKNKNRFQKFFGKYGQKSGLFLCQFLKNKDDQWLAQVIRIIAFGDEDLQQSLIDLLKDPERSEAVREIIRGMGHGGSKILCRRLKTTKNMDFAVELINLLHDLGKQAKGSEALLRERFLNHQQESVQRATYLALLSIEGAKPDLLPQLTRDLLSQNTRHRSQASAALNAGFRQRHGLQLAYRLVQRSATEPPCQPHARAYICKAWGPEAGPVLVELLTKEAPDELALSPKENDWANKILRQLALKIRTIDLISHRLRRPKDCPMTHELLLEKGPQAIPCLFNRMLENDSLVKDRARRCIHDIAKKYGARAVVPALLHMASNKRSKISKDCRQLILKLGAEAVPSLIVLLSRPDTQGGKVAAELLRTYFSAHPEADLVKAFRSSLGIGSTRRRLFNILKPLGHRGALALFQFTQSAPKQLRPELNKELASMGAVAIQALLLKCPEDSKDSPEQAWVMNQARTHTLARSALINALSGKDELAKPARRCVEALGPKIELELLAALSNPRHASRRHVFEMLLGQNPWTKRFLSKLQSISKDPKDPLFLEALTALEARQPLSPSERRDKLRQALQQLSSKEPSRHDAGLMVLRFHLKSHAQDVKAQTKWLLDKQQDALLRAIFAELPERVKGWLVEAVLNQRSVDWRLYRHMSLGVLPRVLELKVDASLNAQQQKALWLMQFGPESLSAFQSALKQCQDPKQRVLLLWALGNMGRKAQPIAAFLKSESALYEQCSRRARAFWTRALFRIDKPQTATAWMLRAAEDSSALVRLELLRGLIQGQISAKDSVALVTRLKQDKDPDVKTFLKRWLNSGP